MSRARKEPVEIKMVMRDRTESRGLQAAVSTRFATALAHELAKMPVKLQKRSRLLHSLARHYPREHDGSSIRSSRKSSQVPCGVWSAAAGPCPVPGRDSCKEESQGSNPLFATITSLGRLGLRGRKEETGEGVRWEGKARIWVPVVDGVLKREQTFCPLTKMI